MAFLKNNYKLILVLWCSVGISLSGYFYIFPKVINNTNFRGYKPLEFDYTNSKIFLLVTIVGIVLIGGFGNLFANKK